MRRAMILLVLALPIRLGAQHSISIDGQFDDWLDVPTAAVDPGGDPHDTDWFGDGLPEPSPMRCSDVDIIEVRFTNDADSLYGYMRAAGEIGRTSSVAAGHARRGRFHFIFTIDVDSDEATGYRLAEGGYWPDSRGYDMNMEIEFYDGLFNTGHYINHEFLTEAQAERQGLLDLADGIVRLAPGTYDHYTQWVMFEDGSYVLVSDRGPVYQGIVTVAVSADGHEAEMKAPMWGFLRAPDGRPIVDLDRWIAVSASLEGSGELSEEALAAGVTDGSRAFWASDTAAPFRYLVSPPAADAFDLAIDILDQSVVNDEPFGPLLVTELEIANRGSASAGALVLTVERTGALAGADWIEFATVAGDGTTAVVSVPDLHAAECFRVLSQPVVSRTR